MKKSTLSFTLAVSAFALPTLAHAQEGPGGNYGSQQEEQERSGNDRTQITPYIEAAQVVTHEFSPGDDTLTYTRVAAGVDATIAGRNTTGGVSLRYERRFGYGDTQVEGDYLSGVARVSAAVVPQTLSIEAGALATRSRFERENVNPLVTGDDDQVTEVYSVFAGPSLTTRAGDVALNAAYRVGYTRVETNDAVSLAPGADPIDVFDESVTHAAQVSAGTRAGEALPIGVTASGGYYQEDIENLDQRARDRYARLDVTVPVSRTVALVGGVGYEDVQLSSRDAVRDAVTGDPVIGDDGRYVTDKTAPRRIAYESDGLIWDAGVMWRPSNRTALEAHVGRRYGSTTYYGSFAYAPSERTSINASVYDNVTGFGGQLNNTLSNLPTNFRAVRNPISGDLGGCVDSSEGGNCLSGVLGSIRSATFRGRGGQISVSEQLGSISAGIGAGYDRRKFFAAQDTVLAAADGIVDETYWVSAYLGAKLDRRSGINSNIYASWFDSGFSDLGDASIYGANAVYYRNLIEGLEASVAVSLDGITRDELEDVWTGAAQVGLRYSF